MWILARKVGGDTRFRLLQWHDFENNRWQVELFFKKLKQNLKSKSFIGTSENAVMTQIWTAAVVTLLIEILKRVARYRWSFLRLLKFVGLNLLTYKKIRRVDKSTGFPNSEAVAAWKNNKWSLFLGKNQWKDLLLKATMGIPVFIEMLSQKLSYAHFLFGRHWI